jgi:hypothetical protein
MSNYVKLSPIIDIHPEKDELIVINRSEATAVSKGMWRNSKRGQQFKITVYEIDGIVTYSIHLNSYIGPEPMAMYYRYPSSWKHLEYPIKVSELFEHFLIA